MSQETVIHRDTQRGVMESQNLEQVWTAFTLPLLFCLICVQYSKSITEPLTSLFNWLE